MYINNCVIFCFVCFFVSGICFCVVSTGLTFNSVFTQFDVCFVCSVYASNGPWRGLQAHRMAFANWRSGQYSEDRPAKDLTAGSISTFKPDEFLYQIKWNNTKQNTENNKTGQDRHFFRQDRISKHKFLNNVLLFFYRTPKGLRWVARLLTEVTSFSETVSVSLTTPCMETGQCGQGSLMGWVQTAYEATLNRKKSQ